MSFDQNKIESCPPPVLLVGLVELPAVLQVLGAKPKVHKVEALLVPFTPTAREEQVGSLDVLVDVAPGVDVLEAVQHLQTHITGGSRREGRLSRVDDRLEVGTVPRQHQEPARRQIP